MSTRSRKGNMTPEEWVASLGPEQQQTIALAALSGCRITKGRSFGKGGDGFYYVYSPEGELVSSAYDLLEASIRAVAYLNGKDPRPTFYDHLFQPPTEEK